MSEFTMRNTHNDRLIAYWLIFFSMLVFTMIVVGGVTRLTDSGLSMVEWKPITGIIPPMNEVEWQAEFDKYKQYPEYKINNADMTLSDFKGIFALEYIHRVIGRLLGMLFFGVFLYLAIRKRIHKQVVPKIIISFVLGGLQGLMGWYMVKSGLSKDPDVSQYRLAAHLFLALLIYAYMLWVAWSLLQSSPQNAWQANTQKLRRLLRMTTAVILLMIFSGAILAGKDAGMVYNTFPLMNGDFFPPDLFREGKPFFWNFTENVTTIQFDHRIIAYVLMIMVPLTWWKATRLTLTPKTKFAFNLLLMVFVIQIILGVTTLIYVVPVSLASLHQAFAILVFTVALYLNHQLRSNH